MTEKKPKAESGKIFPWFRVFASDFLSETSALTPSESGIYIKLLAVMHLHAEPIPDDVGRLARRVGADLRTFRPAREALIGAGLIFSRDGCLWSSLSEGELEHITRKSKIARENVTTRHQKSKQKQCEVSTDVDKKRADIRSERLDDQVPTELDQSPTSHSPKGGDAPARNGAGQHPVYLGAEIYLPEIGFGSVAKVVSRNPLVTIGYFYDDSGLKTARLLKHGPRGIERHAPYDLEKAETLPDHPDEADNDAA